MTIRVTPMIHVPDVPATVAWYELIGFRVVETFDCDGTPNWAHLAFGESRVMLNAGGESSDRERREVDLYIHVEDVEELAARLVDQVDVIEGLRDSFYGMRELIVRDPNGFWVTFGQPVPVDE